MTWIRRQRQQVSERSQRPRRLPQAPIVFATQKGGASRPCSLLCRIQRRHGITKATRTPVFVSCAVYLYDWRLGFLLGPRFLLLTHTGRRSGISRQTVLEVMEYRPESGEAIAMSGFGRDSNWLLNINANPNEKIQLGSRHFRATHRLLGEDEAIRVLASYERRNWLVASIVRRVLSWLTGWPYRGTEEDRRLVVRQLPLIAFRPRGDDRKARTSPASQPLPPASKT